MLYFALKAAHVPGVVLFLGNIITGFFWKAHADRTGDLKVRALALDGISKADGRFTVPGVVFAIAVGPLPKKLLANVRTGFAGTWDESQYKALSRSWASWARVATAAPLIALGLMVMKLG